MSRFDFFNNKAFNERNISRCVRNNVAQENLFIIL